MITCKLCGQEVEVVGKTTMHYVGKEYIKGLKDALKIVKEMEKDRWHKQKIYSLIDVIQAIECKIKIKEVAGEV